MLLKKHWHLDYTVFIVRLSNVVERKKINMKKIEIYSKIKGCRQDGAISNGYLFSFNHQGECTVYETEALEN